MRSRLWGDISPARHTDANHGDRSCVQGSHLSLKTRWKNPCKQGAEAAPVSTLTSFGHPGWKLKYCSERNFSGTTLLLLLFQVKAFGKVWNEMSKFKYILLGFNKKRSISSFVRISLFSADDFCLCSTPNLQAVRVLHQWEVHSGFGFWVCSVFLRRPNTRHLPQAEAQTRINAGNYTCSPLVWARKSSSTGGWEKYLAVCWTTDAFLATIAEDMPQYFVFCQHISTRGKCPFSGVVSWVSPGERVYSLFYTSSYIF